MLLDYTKSRLSSFIEEIDRLKDSEFPYGHSKVALEELRRFFQDRLDQIENLSGDSDKTVVSQHCSLALRDFFYYLPLLGFILRSTNVRNAFETFRPFLRLVRQVLLPTTAKGEVTRLLLSSEWNFSPLTYPNVLNLPGYVFIGLPAPESGNPLLVPLAGHELGHPVWSRQDLTSKYRPRASEEVVRLVRKHWDEFGRVFHPDYVKDDLTDNLFAIETWEPSVEWCLRQAQESFCDFLGLVLFRESFLYSFAYLMSPGLGLGQRAAYYPALDDRAKRLAEAAGTIEISVPDGFASLFLRDTVGRLSSADEFRVRIADEALLSMVADLRDEARRIVAEAKVKTGSKEEKQRILKRFRSVVPAENCESLADVLNAGWQAFVEPEFWKPSVVAPDNRVEVLRDLVLKNLEVFEFEQVLQDDEVGQA